MVADDVRCQVYNSSIDAWVEAIGSECSVPGAQPIPTDDGGGTTPTPGGQGPAAGISPETTGAPDPPPQQNPPPAQPPTATGNGTSAVTPDGGPTASGSDIPPPTRSGTDPDVPLAQQYYRPVNPLPDYGVMDALLAQGLSEAQARGELDDVLKNVPEPGQPHPVFGRNDRADQVSTPDPVELFTGRYRIRVTDLSLPSRGMPIELTRHYGSGIVYFGPWGYNWDHSYNIYLRELDAGAVAVWTGELGEDVYRPDPDGTFRPPLGVHRLLERRSASGPDYWLTDRDGVRMEFETPPGWPLPDRVPLVRIRDRHDNMHSLSYDEQGRVATVSDGLGRDLSFGYGSCGLLERVSDHTGRTWRYQHDNDVEHLVAVTTPATPEYPDGLTTGYEYLTDAPHPALRHNMIRVRNPAGDVVCENTYGDDPYSTDFNRVISQQVGDFATAFTATELQVVRRDPDAVNAPTLRVEVIDPGFSYIYTFNFRGDPLDQRYRLIADGTARLVARNFRYDEQGSLLERWEPDGSGTRCTRDVHHPDPRARANLLSIERVASAASALPSRIVATYTWSADGLRLTRSTGAAGAATAYTYDVDGDPTGRGDLIEVEHPATTLPDGSTQRGAERFRYNQYGQLVEHRTPVGIVHAFTWQDTGVDTGLLRRVVHDVAGAAETVTFEYDTWGHRVAAVDGLGFRWEETVNALGLVTSRRPPAVAGAVDETRLYYDKQCQVRREEWPKGDYADGRIADDFIAHEYRYDLLGHLTEATFGVNTANPTTWTFRRDLDGHTTEAVDPLGRITRQYFDERGLLLVRTEAVGLPEEASWRAEYDRNGRRVSAVDPAGRATTTVWDGFGRLATLALPGSPDSARTRVNLSYDALDQVITTEVTGLIGTGAVGTLSTMDTRFDERSRPVRRSSGGLTTVITYDQDDRAVLIAEPHGGQHTISYDGLGKVLTARDPAGVVVHRGYDACGRLTTVTTTEPQPAGGTRDRTASFGYDPRGRLNRFVDGLGHEWRAEWDARGLVTRLVDPIGDSQRVHYDLQEQPIIIERLDPNQGPLATHTYRRDAAGRTLAYTDPAGNLTSWSYDARDRLTEIGWPDATSTSWRYTSLLQPESEIRPNGTELRYSYAVDGSLARLDVTPGPDLDPVDPIELSCDGLRRVVRITQGASTLHREYDQLSRLIAEQLDGAQSRQDYDDTTHSARFTYPDGRVDHLRYDPIGRLASRTFQTAGSAGATGALAAGTELASWTYGGTTQPAGRHAGAVRSTFGYDDGGRLVAIDHNGSQGNRLTASRYAYDHADRQRVHWAEVTSGGSRRYDYDPLGHLTSAAAVVFPEPAPPMTQSAADAVIATAGTLHPIGTETFTVDEGDSRTAWSWSDPRGASTETYTLDALRTPSRSTRTGRDDGAWSWQRAADGSRLRDDRHRYRYDALGRLTTVQDLAGGTLATLSYDPAGRLGTVTASGLPAIRHHHHGDRRVQSEHGTSEHGTSEHGASVVQYTYGARPDELVWVSDGTNRIVLADAADTVLAVTDAAGMVVEQYTYSAFGQPFVLAPNGTPRTGPTTVPGPVFASYPALPAGLYDARARVYDPASGRFLQPDPHDYGDSADRFGYTHGDPVNFADPSGEAGILVGLLIAAAVGATAGMVINTAHQMLAIGEGAQAQWDWAQFGGSAVGGAVGGIALAFAPEIAVPLAALGVAEGIGEIEEGRPVTGGFDVAAALLPFAFKGVRGSTFGTGTAFGALRGLGPAEGLRARVGNFRQMTPGPRGNPPGVRVSPLSVEMNGATITTAWSKSVSTRLPVLSQWAEATIRAQQSSLELLHGRNIEAARILQPYEPGGALVIEDAGVQADVALHNDSSLRGSYDAYLWQARPAVSGWVGRVPGIGRPIARYWRVGLHDLAPRNIGFVPGRGFVAFDPSGAGNFSGIIGTTSFYGLGGIPARIGDLRSRPAPTTELAGSETALAGGTGK